MGNVGNVGNVGIVGIASDGHCLAHAVLTRYIVSMACEPGCKYFNTNNYQG